MTKTLFYSLFSKALLLLLFSTVEPASAQHNLMYEKDVPPDVKTLMSVRERFVFSVRYGFINLGTVEVELLADTTYMGTSVHHMRTIMRSGTRNPLISTRDVHYQNFFTSEDKRIYSHLFWRDDMHDEEYDRYRIEFDRELEEVRFFELGEPQDTLGLVEPASGGDIIFYFARQFAGLEESFEIPVYIAGEKGSVTASGTGEIESRGYDAFPEDIDTYRMDGNADIDGPFGFTGRFRAWFSTDDLRLPVETHVRIIFGNVRIRLISYEQLDE